MKIKVRVAAMSDINGLIICSDTILEFIHRQAKVNCEINIKTG